MRINGEKKICLHVHVHVCICVLWISRAVSMVTCKSESLHSPGFQNTHNYAANMRFSLYSVSHTSFYHSNRVPWKELALIARIWKRFWYSPFRVKVTSQSPSSPTLWLTWPWHLHAQQCKSFLPSEETSGCPPTYQVGASCRSCCTQHKPEKNSHRKLIMTCLMVYFSVQVCLIFDF